MNVVCLYVIRCILAIVATIESMMWNGLFPCVNNMAQTSHHPMRNG